MTTQPTVAELAAALDQILATAGLTTDQLTRINTPPRQPLAITVTCPICHDHVPYRNGKIARHTPYGAAQPGHRTPWCDGTGRQPIRKDPR